MSDRGTTEGATCNRRVRTGWKGYTPVYTACAGQIVHQGAGQTADGRGVRWIGCELGCWVIREDLAEPDTIPLFGGDL